MMKSYNVQKIKNFETQGIVTNEVKQSHRCLQLQLKVTIDRDL